MLKPATTIDSRMSLRRAAIERRPVPDRWLVRADGFVPKERYTLGRVRRSRARAAVAARVAGRVPRGGARRAPGDYVEYAIGDESVARRAGDGRRDRARSTTRACTAARGSPTGAGTFDRRVHPVPVPRVAVRARRARSTRVVDREEFTEPARRSRAARGARSTAGAASCSSTSTADAEPLLDFLDPLPTLLAPYHLERMRLRAYRTTIIDANWKAVVDAFNEGYHVQGLHPQILPWTDDVSIAYEQFGTHAHYGRLPGARRELRPSPRLGLGPDDYDEGEILAGLVAGLGGAFLGDERAAVDELRAVGTARGSDVARGVPSAPRWSCCRRAVSTSSGFTADQMTSADDVYWFPNLVGPIYPGSALALPRAAVRTRPRPVGQGHVGARVAGRRLGVADAAAPLLRRLDRARLGHDHRAGLRQPRRRCSGG